MPPLTHHKSASSPRWKKRPATELAAIYDEEHQFTVGDRLEFLHWHETYHVDQLEFLRQLAGANDQII